MLWSTTLNLFAHLVLLTIIILKCLNVFHIDFAKDSWRASNFRNELPQMMLWGVPHHWADIPRYSHLMQTHPNHLQASPHFPYTSAVIPASSCGFWMSASHWNPTHPPRALGTPLDPPYHLYYTSSTLSITLSTPCPAVLSLLIVYFLILFTVYLFGHALLAFCFRPKLLQYSHFFLNFSLTLLPHHMIHFYL